MSGSDRADLPSLATSSWALLGILSYDQELSGYDIRKYIGWNMRFYYGSPATSQIYNELKKLEDLGLVTSRMDTSSARSKRLYRISESGLNAVTRWADEAEMEPPTLRHNALLRVTFGHLARPGKLRELLREHVAYAEGMRREAARDAKWAQIEPSWAYAGLVLRWAERYYTNERDLAMTLIDELDDVEATLGQMSESDEIRWPPTEYWYEIERKAANDKE